jgi:hypothetical protein
MINWEKSLAGLLLIIENPSSEKGYCDLMKYYQKNNLFYEADCIDFLIKSKFKNANSTDISKK